MAGKRTKIERHLLNLESRDDHESFTTIAERFGVSAAWVRQIRDDLFESGSIDATSDFAPQAAKWEAGRKLLKQNPDVSTRKLASTIGVTPPTARKIRSDWKMRKEVDWKSWMEGKSLFPYIGSKEKITGWILWRVPEYERFEEQGKTPQRFTRLPQHKTFVEVLGGSATLLYNKPPSEVEIYNDWNEDYSHFIRTLRDHGGEIKNFLEGIPYSKKQYKKWEQKWYRDGQGWYSNQDRPEDDVKRAGIFFYLRFAQFMNKDVGAGYRRPSGNRPQPKEYYAKRDRLPEFQNRFSRDDPEYFQSRFDFAVPPQLDGSVQVKNFDFQKVINRFDAEDTLFYLDPPYVDKESYYPVSDSGFDHEALVNSIRNLEGEFILSYGEVLPDGLDEFRQEMLQHPTADRRERLLFSYPEDKEGAFTPPRMGSDATEQDW